MKHFNKIGDLYKLVVVGLLIAILVLLIQKYESGKKAEHYIQDGYNNEEPAYEIFSPSKQQSLIVDSNKNYNNDIITNSANFFGYQPSARRDVDVQENHPGPSCVIGSGSKEPGELTWTGETGEEKVFYNVSAGQPAS